MAITATKVRHNARKTTNGFWWANLGTTDHAAAAKFYSSVFGWSYEETPLGEMGVHRNAVIGGAQIAGIDPMPAGSTPAWANFIYVEDLDATLAKAKQLGATVNGEPMDVMSAGRMASIVDPTGAAVSFWQPMDHTGADAVNQPNTYSWVELLTSDVAGAKKFYGELLGWTYSQMEGTPMDYWIAELEGHTHAGIGGLPEEMPSPAWVTYFGVEDLDTTRDAVVDAGGSILFEAMQMGPGKGMGVLDPQGAFFTAFRMDEWPTN